MSDVEDGDLHGILYYYPKLTRMKFLEKIVDKAMINTLCGFFSLDSTKKLLK